MGFSGGSDGKASAYNVEDPGSISWVRKIPWRRKQQLTPEFLPGKSHGWRSLVGYALCVTWIVSLFVPQRVGHNRVTSLSLSFSISVTSAKSLLPFEVIYL